MLPGIPGSAICVQGFDDSLNSAIHTTYRISLRPSSLRLPRHPWFAIVKVVFLVKANIVTSNLFTFWFRNKWLLEKKCLIKMYRSAVEGRGRYGYVQQSSRQDLTSTSAECWRLSAGFRFAVGKLTPRDPGTFRTGSDAQTEVNGTASYKTRPPPGNAHLI